MNIFIEQGVGKKMIYEFEGKNPVIGDGTYVHPEATLIGDVVIGKGCFIAPGARLRGDWGSIIIGDYCNIQDNCVIHTKPGKETIIGNRAHIAHGAILHGPMIEDNVFVGMNCVIMDDSILKRDCCLAAGTLVPAGKIIAENTLVMGSPAKEIKQIEEEMRSFLEWGRDQYINLPPRYQR